MNISTENKKRKIVEEIDSPATSQVHPLVKQLVKAKVSAFKNDLSMYFVPNQAMRSWLDELADNVSEDILGSDVGLSEQEYSEACDKLINSLKRETRKSSTGCVGITCSGNDGLILKVGLVGLSDSRSDWFGSFEPASENSNDEEETGVDAFCNLFVGGKSAVEQAIAIEIDELLVPGFDSNENQYYYYESTTEIDPTNRLKDGSPLFVCQTLVFDGNRLAQDLESALDSGRLSLK